MIKIKDIEEFDTRIQNVFMRNDIIYLEEIKEKPRIWFEKMTNLGHKSINIIMNYITNKYYHNLYDYE